MLPYQLQSMRRHHFIAGFSLSTRALITESRWSEWNTDNFRPSFLRLPLDLRPTAKVSACPPAFVHSNTCARALAPGLAQIWSEACARALQGTCWLVAHSLPLFFPSHFAIEFIRSPLTLIATTTLFTSLRHHPASQTVMQVTLEARNKFRICRSIFPLTSRPSFDP